MRMNSNAKAIRKAYSMVMELHDNLKSACAQYEVSTLYVCVCVANARTSILLYV